MKKYILILLLLISLPIYAQNFQWVRFTYHPITYNPQTPTFPSCADKQGSIIYTAIHTFKLSYGLNFYGDVTMKKYNSAGTLMYSKIFYGTAVINDVQTDDNNNVYITGIFMDTLKLDSVNSLINTGSGYNTNYFIVKYNSSGGFVWKKNLNAVYSDNLRLEAFRVKGNAFYIGYYIGSSTSYIKKFDLNGNETLSILHSPATSITSIDVDANGYIYSSGACDNKSISFGGLVASSSFSYNVYFVKFSPSGNGLWVRFVEDITFQRTEVVCDNSGNIYASGFLSDSFMFGTIQAQGPQWFYDFFLTKIDSSGTFLWLREVPNVPGNPTGDAYKGKVRCVAVDSQDNIILAGFTRGTINWGNNVITSGTSSSDRDILILKYDSSGTIQWGKTAGGAANDRVEAISFDNTGNLLLSGNFALTATFDTITVIGSGYLNSYVARIFPGTATGIGNSSTVLNYRLFQNYPNPFNPSTTINYSLDKSSNVKIIVYDALGKETSTLVNGDIIAGSHKAVFSPDNLSAGVYYYSMFVDGELFETKKMVLVK